MPKNAIKSITNEYLNKLQNVCHEKGVEAVFEEFISHNVTSDFLIAARYAGAISIAIGFKDAYKGDKVFPLYTSVAVAFLISMPLVLLGFRFEDEKSFPKQNELINRILKFCVEAKIDGENIFSFFTDPSKNDNKYKQEIADFKSGLCFGLSSLFIQSSFISDMQENDKICAQEDDLVWFCKCVTLLKLPNNTLTTEQKLDVARFISLITHFQNSILAPGIALNIFEPNTSFSRGLYTNQAMHFINAEFTGNNALIFNKNGFIINNHNKQADISSYDTLKKMREFLSESNKPLYLMLRSLMMNNDAYLMSGAHMMSLHKNKAGIFTFYDPNNGFSTLKLDAIVDLLSKGSYQAFVGETIPQAKLKIKL